VQVSSAESSAVRIADFNLQLATYAHSSWAGELATNADAQGWRSNRVVSRILAYHAGVLDVHDWRMEEQSKRIFLMDVDDVQRLALELGVSLQREHLAVQVRRERVLAMRAAFGEELMSFLYDEVPASLPFAPSGPPKANGLDAGELRQQAGRLGAQALLALLGADWMAVKRRAVLMFDRSWNLDSKAEGLSGRSHKTLLSFVVEKLITKRLPQWQWLY